MKLYGEKFGTENVKIIQDSDKVTCAMHLEIVVNLFQAQCVAPDIWDRRMEVESIRWQKEWRL